MSSININPNQGGLFNQGELAIEDGSVLVYDGDTWVATATSEDRTEALEKKVAELELLVKRLIAQLAPEMKV